MKSTARWLAAVAFAVAMPAVADTVTIQWTAFGTPGPVDSVSTHLVSPSNTFNGPAERFTGKVTGFTGALTASAFVDSANTLYAYCYDLLQSIHSGTYTVNSVGATTLAWLGAVDYVLNGNTNTWLDSYAWLHPGNGNVSAAIQLGIWESLYDSGNNFDLSSGNLTVTNVDSATLTAYNSFVSHLADANALPSNLAMAFVSDGNQDVITGRRPTGKQLPEPGSLLLLGIAVAAAGWSLRRKQ